jgi:glycosyltransferase involved in cell wall biosynthesis
LSNVSVSLPALSQFISKINRTIGGQVPFSILFWGAMSRPENYEAIIKFLDSGWDKLSQQFPASVLYIVGSNPPAQLLRRASGRVIVTGYLDDPSNFFEKASIGIVPLEQGAGVKVKVLEMLEAGIPVISTPVGAEGVESNPLLRVVDFDEISDAVISFFKDIDLS